MQNCMACDKTAAFQKAAKSATNLAEDLEFQARHNACFGRNAVPAEYCSKDLAFFSEI